VKRVVLDASAVMTFFDDRPGADKVEEILGRGIEGKAELLMSVVNWGEVYYSVWRARGEVAAQKVLAEIAQLPIEIVDADRELTKVAAEFRARHKLPYADCFGAALAKVRKAAIATADRDFVAVKHEVPLLEI
jgi:predicted nucleic acid-binding protein